MDISRQEFLDEFSLREAAREGILRDLMGRNKANQQMILDFHNKKRRIQHKLKSGVSEPITETIQVENEGGNGE